MAIMLPRTTTRGLAAVHQLGALAEESSDPGH